MLLLFSESYQGVSWLMHLHFLMGSVCNMQSWHTVKKHYWLIVLQPEVLLLG